MNNEFGQPIGPSVENWTARPFPTPTLLRGRSCELHGLDFQQHRNALSQIFVNQYEPQQWTYLGYGPFTNVADFDHWLESVSPKRDEKPGRDPQFYTVRGIDDGSDTPTTLLGMLSLMRIAPEHGVMEIGHIHFSSAVQRTPITTEANFLLISRAFDELGYRRMEWKCDSLNQRSRRAAERLGFTFEGVFRNATVYKKRSRDTAWYSIVDREWPTIKQSIERWLAPDNFDAEGNQRARLEDFRSQ